MLATAKPLLVGTVDESQKLSDCSTRFRRVSKWLIGEDSVVVLAANLFAFDDPAGFEIGDDPLHGALGDSHLQRHFSKHQRRISRQHYEHVRMIREKRPTRRSRFRGGRHDRKRC